MNIIWLSKSTGDLHDFRRHDTPPSRSRRSSRPMY